MTKKDAKKKIVFVALLMIVCIVLTFFRFDIPFTNKTYNGFINSIKMGLDVQGGVAAVYETKLPDDSQTDDLGSAVDSTVQRLQNILADRGYPEATVTTQQGTRIRVEVPDVEDPQEVFDLIGTPAKLYFKTENTAEADAVITGSHIKSVEYGMQDNTNGVIVKFNSTGKKLFSDLTTELASSGEPIYVYLGAEYYTTLNVNEAITGGSTFISRGSGSEGYTRQQAEDFALQLMSGTFAAELTLLESSVISPTLGMNAISSGLIAGVIGLILIMAFMILIYRMMGVCASIALIFYVMIVLFFLQAIPLVQLTLPGIAGIILGIGMAVDANVVIFERIKDEYKRGKRIPASIDAGFKRAQVAIFDSNITSLLVSLVLYIFGSGSIQGFASTLFISIAVSMFSCLVITRALLKIYLPFNSTNANKYNLTREVEANANI